MGALSVDGATGDLSSGLWPWFLTLAIVAVLNAAISAAYYLRIIAVMYFRPAVYSPPAQGGAGAAWATALCSFLVVVAGIFPGSLLETTHIMCRAARRSIGAAAIAGPAAPPLRVATTAD
jgi:hypothetical protein